MADNLLHRLKPGASIRVHLLVAALIWSMVGLGLMTRGFLFVRPSGRYWFALLGAGLGTIKSIWVLDRVARKNIRRTSRMEDGACIGSVYSFKTWGLILCMILLGRLLRLSGLPGEYIGIVYCAIGWGLFLSSRLLWQARFQLKTED